MCIPKFLSRCLFITFLRAHKNCVTCVYICEDVAILHAFPPHRGRVLALPLTHGQSSAAHAVEFLEIDAHRPMIDFFPRIRLTMKGRTDPEFSSCKQDDEEALTIKLIVSRTKIRSQRTESEGEDGDCARNSEDAIEGIVRKDGVILSLGSQIGSDHDTPVSECAS
nr:hypothetical protein CFP56_38844 [Quercus suber]